MSLEAQIIKEIPEKQLNQFKDRVVYYTASLTREYTKGMGAYPELSGDLKRYEIASHITGGNAQYNLLAGVDYAKYVWNFNNVKWTNPNTIPKWYYNVYRQKGKIILTNASTRAMREIK